MRDLYVSQNYTMSFSSIVSDNGRILYMAFLAEINDVVLILSIVPILRHLDQRDNCSTAFYLVYIR